MTVGAVAAAEPRTIEISTTPAPAIEVEVAADEASEPVESADQPENGTSDNA